MDPLDPLTEIINSGQAFSPAIALERIIWLIIGFLFIGAITKSIMNGMKNQVSISKNPFFQYFKSDKDKDEGSQ